MSQQQPEATVPHPVNNNGTTNHTTSNSSSSSNIPISSTTTTTNTTSTEELLYSAFRQKTIDMKHWVPLPDSMPSNRDRLELYALHRQAISGDAPTISTSNMNQQWNATDRAKYQAWKSKSGISTTLAMQQYIQEADRQVRVYGTSLSSTSSSTVQPGKSIQDSGGAYYGAQQHTSNHHPTAPPTSSRGLAAIPLLCAAASEQRISYLRRIQCTSYYNAWWKRQEPLLAPPYTIYAIPEHILLGIATGVETVSLYVTYTHGTNEATSSSNNGATGTAPSTNNDGTMTSGGMKANNTTNGGTTVTMNSTNTTTLIPHVIGTTIQSYLWPFHNVLLSTWMTIILIYMILSTALQCTSTILLGSRRTGMTLHTIYHEQIIFVTQSIYTIMESHQPVSVRCIGLIFLPYTFLLRILRALNPTLTTTTTTTNEQPPTDASSSSSSSSNSSLLVSCSMYSFFVGITIWYWLWIIPLIVLIGMDYICAILLLGPCFAIIELASHL